MIHHENYVHKVSPEEARDPYVEVDFYSNLDKAKVEKDSDPKVTEKLSSLRKLIVNEQSKSKKLDKKLSEVLDRSHLEYADLLNKQRSKKPVTANRRVKCRRKNASNVKISQKKTVQLAFIKKPQQKYRRPVVAMSHNLMNYAF